MKIKGCKPVVKEWFVQTELVFNWIDVRGWEISWRYCTIMDDSGQVLIQGKKNLDLPLSETISR